MPHLLGIEPGVLQAQLVYRRADALAHQADQVELGYRGSHVSGGPVLQNIFRQDQQHIADAVFDRLVEGLRVILVGRHRHRAEHKAGLAVLQLIVKQIGQTLPHHATIIDDLDHLRPRLVVTAEIGRDVIKAHDDDRPQDGADHKAFAEDLGDEFAFDQFEGFAHGSGFPNFVATEAQRAQRFFSVVGSQLSVLCELCVSVASVCNNIH